MTQPPSTSPAPPAALLAHLAGRVEVGAPIGAGQSGTVYRGRVLTAFGDLAADAPVAIKVVRADLEDDAAALEQLRQEGTLGRLVDCRHVVTIHELGELDGGRLVYLLCEFVPGRTLRALLTDLGRPLPGDLARRIIEQAARGLAALHRAGIIHRDVKPENLLVTPEHEVRLVDLGLARRAGATEAGEASHGSGFRGSVAYAAPELLRGRPATPWSDLYALGVVLFELLTGRHPFAEADSADALLHDHLHRKPPRPSHLVARVSAFLDLVVEQLLAKDPSVRFRDAEELAETLARGEASPFWRTRERLAPVLAATRRLEAMRRASPTPLFDRDSERATLDAALAEARGGRCQVVLLRGPRGSGRRRLLDDTIAAWLSDEDHQLLFLGGVAEDSPSSPRGAPFPALLLDEYLHGEDERAPRAAERLAARLQDEAGLAARDAERTAELAVGRGESGRGAASAAERAHLLVRALAAIPSRRGRARGETTLLIRIDRAELLGDSARLVVERLLDAPDLPILLLLVGTHDVLATTHPGFRELRIGGLPPADFEAFGRALFRRGEAPSDELLHAAWTATSGLPGALLESLDDVVLRGALAGRPGDYHAALPSFTELRPPRPVLQRLRDRTADLPREVRHVLEAAAVLGDSFAVQDVVELTGRPELEVLEALAAFDERVVVTDGGHGRFRHRDLRRAVRGTAPAGVLRRLHRSAGWLLEERGAAPLEIGMHLSRAGEHRAALPHLLAGLQQLLDQGSRRNAVRVAERIALHFAALLGGREATGDDAILRLGAHLLAGEAFARVGRDERATTEFRAANLLAEQTDRAIDKARALIGLADVAQRNGRLLTALQLLTDAERRLATQPDREARLALGRARLVHARVLAYQGDSLAALRHTSEGLRDLPNDPGPLRVHLLVDHARWQALQLRFLRALESLDLAEEQLQNAPDPSGLLRVHLHRGRFLAFLGDREGSDASLETAHDLATRLGDERMRGRALMFRAEARVYVGEHAVALPLLQAAEQASRRAGDRIAGSLARCLRGLAGEVGDEPLPTDTGVPIVDLTARLAEVLRLRAAGDPSADARLDEALALSRRARVHLLLRIALHRAAADSSAGSASERHVRRLVGYVARRLPAGPTRRRFVQFTERIRPGPAAQE